MSTTVTAADRATSSPASRTPCGSPRPGKRVELLRLIGEQQQPFRAGLFRQDAGCHVAEANVTFGQMPGELADFGEAVESRGSGGRYGVFYLWKERFDSAWTKATHGANA